MPQAQALLAATLLTPRDLRGAWNITSDTTQDNAAAAAADPASAASNQRCGRLLGRTVLNLAADPVNAFLGGQTLSFFSTAVVYATGAGAADCAAEAAQRLARPGQLARAFASVFINPEAVQVALVDYPQIGDGSFAATLTGQANASGTVIDLTILVVGFRTGNVTAAVGSARSGSTPPTVELTPLVNLVLQRISANQ